MVLEEVFSELFLKKTETAQKAGKKDAEKHDRKGARIGEARVSDTDRGKIDADDVNNGIGATENYRCTKPG